MGIVGINRKGTQTPAGKMKFTFIFIGVMLLRGIELHRHMNQHGQKKHKTDPHTESEKDYDVELNEKDELNRIGELDHLNEAVHERHHVHATEVQTDTRSSPGDNIENDGTELAHDSNITPKPNIRRNKLVAKYGTNFRYLGIVKNGIDRVTVVTSIPIPRYENLKVKPINFAKCAIALEKMTRIENTLKRQILGHLKRRKNGVLEPFHILSI